MPAPRSQHAMYCRFRCAYRKVARVQPVDTVCDSMMQCMACDGTDSSHTHDACECACSHGSRAPRRDGARDVSRRDGASYDVSRYIYRRDGADYVFRRDGANSLLRRDGAQEPPPGGRCFDTSSLHTAVIYHMQRKLLGYCLEKIYKAQDYMATFCYEDHRGFLTEDVKRKVVQLNYALAPWYKMVGTITTHKRLQDVVTWSTQKQSDYNHCIYARISLQCTHSMYIGETGNLDQRIKQHYFATCKHRHDAPNPCKGCKEHMKYRKHRSAQPHEWITIPIMYVSSEHEAKRVEKCLIKNLKPNLNASEKPFWLLKDTYARQFRNYGRGRNNPMSALWRKPEVQPSREQKAYKSSAPSMPILTTYTYKKTLYADFAAILRQIQTEGEITVHPGKHDITKWQRVRELYGSSIIYTASDTYTLRKWNTNNDPQTIKILVAQEEGVSTKEFNAIFKDIAAFKEQLRAASDDDLHFYWRVRHDVQKARKYKVRKMVWDECITRYGCTAKPIEIRLPYFEEMQPTLITQWIRRKIKATAWPDFIKNWHLKRIRLITETQPTISGILSNVTSPFNNCNGACCCAEVRKRLAQKGFTGDLPMIDGHIFGIGRDYEGPNAEALNVGANNIPQQTKWDLHRAWDKTYQQLPEWMRPSKSAWTSLLNTVTRPVQFKQQPFTKTKAVYTLRKDMQGLMIGPIDKNINELWFCCPVLYRKAWDKAYSQTSDYQRIYPKNAKKTRGATTAYETHEIHNGGTTTDIIQIWERQYRKLGWDQIATYDKKGGFNRPYILFKNKNIVDHSVRKEKWIKARPIAPQTKHPMKRLFHLTGRAWSFITANIPGEHLVLNNGSDLPRFFANTQDTLRPHGMMKVAVKDIEGCFPNMDKTDIQQGLQGIVDNIRQTHGYDAVFVPSRKTQQCSWKQRKGYKK